MPIFLAVVALGAAMIGRAIIAYRKSYTLSWIEMIKAGTGVYWLLAVTHVLYLTSRTTISECLTTSQQFLWPGIIFSLSVLIANDLISEKKAEVERDRNTDL